MMFNAPVPQIGENLDGKEDPLHEAARAAGVRGGGVAREQ